MTAKPKEVKNLNDLFDIAKEKGVGDNYLEYAGNLKDRMSMSIECNDIFKAFERYPHRYAELKEYPPDIVWDPK